MLYVRIANDEGRSGKYPEAFTYLKNKKQYLYNHLLDGRLKSIAYNNNNAPAQRKT